MVELIVTAINVFILFFLIGYLVSDMLSGMLTKRQERIADDINTARMSKEEALALKNDYEHRLADFESERADILENTRRKAAQMEELIMQVKSDGDTIGGVITCVVEGCPAGLGEPEFGKLHAQLGSAMLSINAVKGFEYGDGFDMASHRGSEVNDLFDPDGSHVTLTNHSGGIQGGISNGEDICFRVAFKPVATLLRPQATIDTDGNATQLEVKGRHDPCVLPRAVPVVEAMAAMVILDSYLVNKTTHL